MAFASLYPAAAAAAHRAALPGSARADGAEPEIGVVLERLGDGALGLGQGARGGVGRLGQRAAERGDHERVRLLVEREGAGLARAADHAARGAGEADEVL